MLGYFQSKNEVPPVPRIRGPGDATDLNPESVRDSPGQSSEATLPSPIVAHRAEDPTK